jgi:hypothetical protein
MRDFRVMTYAKTAHRRNAPGAAEAGIIISEGVILMKRNNALIKTLAIVGTILVWLPVLAPLVMTRWAMLGQEGFGFDWLIPAELAPIVAVGAALLLAAALLSRARRAWVLWGIGIMVAGIVLGSVIAQVSGLANGAVEPAETGWWIVVVGMIALYVAGIVETGVAGILMLRDLFRHHAEDASQAMPASPTPA